MSGPLIVPPSSAVVSLPPPSPPSHPASLLEDTLAAVYDVCGD